MDRILGLSLVGAGPGNIFGPGMSAGALESFARGGNAVGSSGCSAGETGSSALRSGGTKKDAAGRTNHAEAEAKSVGGQEVRGSADANARLHSALDGLFFFEVVAPH